MNFYIRKSISIGPIRLNLSKLGVGISFGARGARPATGPRGSYIHMARDGIYYRQRMDGKVKTFSTSQHLKVDFDSYSPGESGNVNSKYLINSTNAKILDQINERIHQKGNAWIVAAMTLTLYSLFFILSDLFLDVTGLVDNSSLYQLLANVSYTFANFSIPLGIWAALVTAQQDHLARHTNLHYQFDENMRSKYSRLQNALKKLSTSECVWEVTTMNENLNPLTNSDDATSILELTRFS